MDSPMETVYLNRIFQHGMDYQAVKLVNKSIINHENIRMILSEILTL